MPAPSTDPIHSSPDLPRIEGLGGTAYAPNAADAELCAATLADQCWSFLLSQQLALESMGHSAEVHRCPSTSPGISSRMYFTWIPGSCSPVVANSWRQYTLEISLPADGGAPRAIFAGCGINSASTLRLADDTLPLRHTLQDWFAEFKQRSTAMHAFCFVHSGSGGLN